MMQKQQRIRIKKIRDSARNMACTMNSPACNYDITTVVLAHYNTPGESGTGLKNDDTSAAYLCSGCHFWADAKTGRYTEQDHLFYWFRACRRTWRLLITEGVLK